MGQIQAMKMEETFLSFVLKIMEVGILIYIIPNMSPNGTYTPYNIEPADKLQGPYKLNTVLNDAEQLYTGLIKGPESIAVVDDGLYTGVYGGYVIKLDNDTVEKVVKFGEECDGIWQEKKCGRPFGLLSGENGDLYISDAYYGIWKYNVRTKDQQCLVGQNTSIDGKTPKLFNGIAVSGNGDMYWTDTSTEVDIQNGFYAMFQDGTGRLIKYSPKTDENTVLLDQLYFPNGIVLSPNENFIVVSEMMTSRLIRYYIDGPKKGQKDIFLNNLPGFPDKLKVHDDYILVPLIHARDRMQPVFFQYMSPYPLVRKAVVWCMGFMESIMYFLHTLFNTSVFEALMYTIGHFETVSVFAPIRVTVLVVNWKGEVVTSWHNLDKSLSAVSDVQIYNNHIYYGSPYNEYVGRTRIPKTFGKI